MRIIEIMSNASEKAMDNLILAISLLVLAVMFVVGLIVLLFCLINFSFSPLDIRGIIVLCIPLIVFIYALGRN